MSEPRLQRANSDERKENPSELKASTSINPSSMISSASISDGTGNKTESDFKQGSKCLVCSKKFSITVRRHHCRFCNESVCDLHSMKRRARTGESEKLRICDNCDKEFIKEEVRKEVEEEILKLEKQVQHAKAVNEKLYKEHYEKTAKVSQLELELTRAERQQKQKEQALQERLAEEQSKGNRARLIVDELRNSLENSRNCEKDVIEKCASTEKELEDLKKQTENLRERRNELIGQIDHLTSRLKGSLPLDQVRELMCPRCKARLNQTYKPLAPDGTIREVEEEDDDSSFV